MASHVLVIESDDTIQQLLGENPQLNVHRTSSWKAGLDAVASHDIGLVIADAQLACADPAGLVDLRARAADAPMLLVARPTCAPGAHGSSRPSEALFLGRLVPAAELPRAIDDALMERTGAAERRRPVANGEVNGILAESAAMRRVISIIDRAAPRDTPVLLVGESGTGKELLARALHRQSVRAHGPFVAVNCSAIPDALLESELFGHRRGAFTSASNDQRGLFQLAHRGTIFLDEIGDMAPALQGKLLRALQEKEVHPLGAPTPVPVDVRTVTATHRDLDALVNESRFREDLLYRINVIEVRVPPLRDRPDDLAPLVAHFLRKHGRRLGKADYTVSSDAMALLNRYSWPGNVRQLENVIERALVLGAGPVIDVDDLPERLRQKPRLSARPALWRSLADVERDYILGTLRAVSGNKAAAARSLGLSRKTLYGKLRQYHISLR